MENFKKFQVIKFKQYLVESSFVIDENKHKDAISAWRDFRFPFGPNKNRISDLAKSEWIKEKKKILSIDEIKASLYLDLQKKFDKFVNF